MEIKYLGVTSTIKVGSKVLSQQNDCRMTMYNGVISALTRRHVHIYKVAIGPVVTYAVEMRTDTIKRK